ncbi:MAG: prephenate dehydratase [Clostridia bacterium]|nr:prephenate dehydratase [Lachnospiraceae bacterium]NCC01466.1 prephenate dehydratase [Clostridia bacterium]NCD02130.1 prephenate dehydratase [Clostridia bacterium]
MEDLIKLRDEIDIIDDQIVSLYERRMAVAEGVAAYKRSVGKPVLDKEREKIKIQKVTAKASNDFNRQGVESLFSQIMAVSRMLQYQKLASEGMDLDGFHMESMKILPTTKVVYTGVPGAYAEAAMNGYFGQEIDGFNVETFGDAMEAVQSGKAEYGVLPIENSSTGSVNDVYDLLSAYDNHIVGEYMVKIEHALLGLPGSSLENIHTVYSHPQGLMQCSQFLDKCRDWQQVSLQNTAASAKRVMDDKDLGQAAIASKQAAKNYGLVVLKEKLNDLDNNSTRFVVISNKKTFQENADKISICFELPHESGSLYSILGHFIFNGLNMTRIESRPIKGEPWQYRFFIDFNGNLREQAVRNALHGIQSETESFRILGNYIGVEQPC